MDILRKIEFSKEYSFMNWRKILEELFLRIFGIRFSDCPEAMFPRHKKWSFPLRIWLYLLKKSLMENFIFCAVSFAGIAWSWRKSRDFEKEEFIFCSPKSLSICLQEVTWKKAELDFRHSIWHSAMNFLIMPYHVTIMFFSLIHTFLFRSAWFERN